MNKNNIHKTFSIAAIVSVCSGRLLCSFDEMHKLFEFVVGRPVMTHELPSLQERVAKHLETVLPLLKTVATEHINRENYAVELQKIEKQLGKSAEIIPMSVGANYITVTQALDNARANKNQK